MTNDSPPAQRADGASKRTNRRRRVLAVSSGGGHWVQLLRLRPAIAHHETVFVTVRPEYRADLEERDQLIVIRDATRWDKLGLIHMTLQLAWAMIKVRPDVVVSTGAAPGLVALRLGKFMRARTIWIDSLANCETLSLSGQRARGMADLWLTQWEHLAEPDGPTYAGSVA